MGILASLTPPSRTRRDSGEGRREGGREVRGEGGTEGGRDGGRMVEGKRTEEAE